jgi:hypothetical protein
VPEITVVAVLGLLAGFLAALALRSRAPDRTTATGAGFGFAATVVAVLAAAATHRVPAALPQPDDLPLHSPEAGDATSTACRSCHPDEYASWHASYHRTMTQVASPHAVLGDFRDARVEFGGERYRLFERDGNYFAEITPAHGDAPARTAQLQQTTGSHHMQIYWNATGSGRAVESFPLVWLRGEERWIPRLAAFVVPPSDEAAQPSSWNTTCIGCHTTHPRPRLTFAAVEHADSRVTEFGIACEACHGSGADHAASYRSPLARYRAHWSEAPEHDITNPARLSHRRSAQVCGQCHAVKTFYSDSQARAWAERGSPFRPGADLDAVVSIVSSATLARPYTQEMMQLFPDFVPGSFWDDGIVRVVGREYNAILESGCFQRGELSCISCHEVHQAADDPRDSKEWANDQLAVGMETDRACTQCHSRYADPQRAAEHTHHRTGSTGSACLNCHMPHTAYGLLKAVRSHEIHSPRVRTAGPGSTRPNACNLCHLDRPLGWTADALSRWYGQDPPPLSDDDRRIAAGVRWALTGDAGVRAITAWAMGWVPAQQAGGTAWSVPYLVDLMDDPYDAVRMVAARSLARIPGFAESGFDPLAATDRRAAAARALRERSEPIPAGTESAGATLFDAQGRRRADEVARLRAKRDDHPLTLAE